jgi:hypothetical protein
VSLVAAAPPTAERQAALASIGCPMHVAGQQPLMEIPGLAGAIAVGHCDAGFLGASHELRHLGCKLVWANCMTWVFPLEARLYADGFRLDAHVYQSEFQRESLERYLSRFGYRPEQGHLIRGPFLWNDWPFEFQPRDPADAFVVGRLARPDLGKWSRRTWEIYSRIEHPRRHAVVMGVDDRIRKWIGPAPSWAEVLPPKALAASEFYRRIHCLMPINFSAQENWPRVGLEAMAQGVPIVAPRKGGWRDMIRHGENGFLAGSVDEFAALGTRLARDEPLRREIAVNARRMLEQELANPDAIWSGWQRLFAGLR